jgi:hypothetical protein
MIPPNDRRFPNALNVSEKKGSPHVRYDERISGQAG